MGLLVVVVATLFRLLLDPAMPDRATYGPCLIATAFVAWRYGLGPALVTLGGGAVLACLLFEEPRFTLLGLSNAGQAAFIFTLLIGLTTALLCESLRVAARYHACLARQAREADARKDEFLATLSHELRNPLAPIRFALYQLEHIEANNPRATQLRQLIDSQMEYLVRLVNDLLDVSRITRGKVELQLERAKLSSIVDAALNLVRPMLEDKEHNLQVTLPPAEVYLKVDAMRLTQVLSNLLHNAAKYTENRGRIWLNVQTEDEQVVIRVRDTGIGISPEMQHRIFDLFQQAHSSIEKSQGGLGIGLTLARNLVEMHGGSLAVSSPGLGLGSEFTVRLPVVENLEESVPQPSSEIVPQARTWLRILVVDDSVAVATTLADVLRLWKHTVEVANDAFSALEVASRFKPDVILADLGLPRMNGYQFAEEVRRLPGMEHVVLIAVSGYGQTKDQERSKAAGFVRHLVKPVGVNELELAIAQVAPQDQ
jgi:signal transduction histidine kinase/ActR/RegA family two-component response regulator